MVMMRCPPSRRRPCDDGLPPYRSGAAQSSGVRPHLVANISAADRRAPGSRRPPHPAYARLPDSSSRPNARTIAIATASTSSNTSVRNRTMTQPGAGGADLLRKHIRDTAVQLDDRPLIHAHKIGNERPHRILTAKLQTTQPPTPKSSIFILIRSVSPGMTIWPCAKIGLYAVPGLWDSLTRHLWRGCCGDVPDIESHGERHTTHRA